MEKEWTVRRYESADADAWNSFVADARNATFLFDRRYMDYHSDRFADCSLMAFHGGKLAAVLPANADGDVLRSHGGLTYGGWILPPHHLDASGMDGMWNEWLRYCRDEGFRSIDYKPLPHIYHRYPSEEDRYLLFRYGAELSECSLSSTIDLASPRQFNSQMRRHLRKAEKAGAEVRETSDARAFMLMLEECLRQRHATKPVHSAEELILLRSRFPENIRIFTVDGESGAPAAGVCVYDTGIVAHAQYIATTAEGRDMNLLPLLFHRLITETFRSRRYFDFGISCEDHGRYLNAGLLRQKSGLGGTGTVYSRYLLRL